MPTATRPVRPCRASGEHPHLGAAVEADRVGAGRHAREQVGDAEEARHEVGAGLLVELAGRPELLDPAAVHDGDRVRHGHGLFLVVRHVDEGHAELALDQLELELHLPAQLEVERSERLVEEQHPRPVHERAGEGDPLLLAARELARLAGLEAGEIDELEDLPHASSDVVLAGLPSGASRTRCSRRRRGAGRARSSGRPCSRRACRAEARARSGRRGRSLPRWAPRSRRSCAASSSSRSRRARGGRRSCRPGSRSRCRRPRPRRRSAW